MSSDTSLYYSPNGCFSISRRTHSEGDLGVVRGESNRLRSTTIDLTQTYKKCNPEFQEVKKLPARMLTQPAEPSTANNHDNKEGNLICRVHDTIESEKDLYTVLDILGTGTFGQVFRCQIKSSGEVVAVKVVKGKPAYRNQGLLEIKIAKLLNTMGDPDDKKHIVRILDSFEYLGHICIVFELLGSSLLDILTHNQFRGLSLATVQKYTKQLLQALIVLQDVNIIHCDLKPENILLCSKPSSGVASTAGTGGTSGSAAIVSGKEESEEGISQDPPQLERSTTSLSDLKMIDFGSACFEGKTMYSYIQSRFYRCPEVLVGVPYNGAIDMWSLGCVCAEMFLGLPLFPGVSQHNQLSRIVDMLGPIPDFLVSQGKNGPKFFTKNKSPSDGGSVWDSKQLRSQHKQSYRLKTAEEFAIENNTSVPAFRKYLRYDKLDEIILKCPLPRKSKLTSPQKIEEMNRRKCFLDFLGGLFRLNPWERWTAKQAYAHPFIRDFHGAGTGMQCSVAGGDGDQNFRVSTTPFIPPPDPIMEKRLQQYQNKVFDEDANGKLSSAAATAPSSGHQFVPLKKSDRRESEPVVLPTQAQTAMERGGSSPRRRQAEDKSLWSSWSLWPKFTHHQPKEEKGHSATDSARSEQQSQQGNPLHTQQQEQQPRGSLSDTKAQAPRRKSNPYSYQSQQEKYSQMPSSQLFGSPPDAALPVNYMQWHQQRQQEQSRHHDQTTMQQPPQQTGQAYSFSSSMMGSLFKSPGQSQAQVSRQSTGGVYPDSGGAVPIPMPTSTGYPHGTGLAVSPQTMSSPYGSLSSSYGNSFIASSMGGVGNLAGLTSTDFGHVLNRPEMDENKYLQSFAFQQSLRHQQQQQQASSSYGNQRRYSNSGGGQKLPLSQSYSIDYSGSGIGGQISQGFSPQSGSSYMERPNDHSRYASMGASPQDASYIPLGGRQYHPSQSGMQGVPYGFDQGRNGREGMPMASSAPHTHSAVLNDYRGPSGRDGGMRAYDPYAMEAGLPSGSFGDMSMNDSRTATKDESASRTHSQDAEKSGDGDDDMIFESDDLLAGDV